MHTHSPNKARKFKQNLPARNLIAAVFWDRKGVLMVKFMQKGTAITSHVYCETLKILLRAIQNKRRGMLTPSMTMRIRITASRTRALLEHFNWELFDHPPQSPDLALSYYCLFRYVKNWLGSQRFNNNEESMEAVKTWLSFFDTGTQKLIARYKCLNSGSDYVEE
jgi:hypothetical protein